MPPASRSARRPRSGSTHVRCRCPRHTRRWGHVQKEALSAGWARDPVHSSAPGRRARDVPAPLPPPAWKSLSPPQVENARRARRGADARGSLSRCDSASATVSRGAPARNRRVRVRSPPRSQSSPECGAVFPRYDGPATHPCAPCAHQTRGEGTTRQLSTSRGIDQLIRQRGHELAGIGVREAAVVLARWRHPPGLSELDELVRTRYSATAAGSPAGLASASPRRAPPAAADRLDPAGRPERTAQR